MLLAPLVGGPSVRVEWRRRLLGNRLIDAGKWIHRWAGGRWL
jgi:hypothetical protein